MTLGGEARKEGFLQYWYHSMRNHRAATEHDHEFEHTLRHVRGLEGEGHYGGVSSIGFSFRNTWLAQPLVEEPYGVNTMCQRLRRELCGIA